jgi:caa(3)-type oxidase subunit IV
MATTAHAHPAAKTYWLVGLGLAVLTAFEIATPYTDMLDPVRAPLLIAMGLAKFVIVAAVFMHLKYDLKGYRWVFSMAVAGALLVFAVVLAVFQAF